MVVSNLKVCVLVFEASFASNEPALLNSILLFIGVFKSCPSIETFTSIGTLVRITS